MSLPTKDLRDANGSFVKGMLETSGNLFLLALLFGGSAFFLQWAFWFLAVGIAVHTTVKRGADAADWVYGKLPSNPFNKNSNEASGD
jgi:hypothetical protein